MDEGVIVKNNKLIAKFMNIQVTDFQWKDYKTLIIGDENDAMDYGNLVCYHPDNDWNQLMHVVEKTLLVANELNDLEKFSTITDQVPYINEVYKAVVEFIKWYNGKVNNN